MLCVDIEMAGVVAWYLGLVPATATSLLIASHPQPTAQGQTMISHYWHQRTSHLKCLLNRIDYLYADFAHFSCQEGQQGSVIRSVIQCSLDRTEPSKAFARNSRKCHKCYICEVSHPIANRAFLFNSDQKILLQ